MVTWVWVTRLSFDIFEFHLRPPFLVWPSSFSFLLVYQVLELLMICLKVRRLDHFMSQITKERSISQPRRFKVIRFPFFYSQLLIDFCDRCGPFPPADARLPLCMRAISGKWSSDQITLSCETICIGRLLFAVWRMIGNRWASQWFSWMKNLGCHVKWCDGWIMMYEQREGMQR